MPVWLTLIGGILATLGFLGAVFGLVTTIVQGKRVKGEPKFGFFSKGKKGVVGIWVGWDPATFDVKFYRVRLTRVSPEMTMKEATSTLTFENTMEGPFCQWVTLPPAFAELLQAGANAMVTIEVRSTEEYGLIKTMKAKKFKEVCLKESAPPRGFPEVLPEIGADVPAVMSLDFSELQERKKKLKALEAAASAKAAKAPPPKPTTAPTPPVSATPARAP